jgi:hypothetical protein
VKAKATKRATVMATRVASNDKGDGDGNKGGRLATATRAMAAATTVVGKDEGNGNGNGNEGGGPQRGWGQHGDGNCEKDGGQAIAMTTNRAVVMAMRVAGKDEGNGESGKSNGNGDKEGDCKEEGNGKQWWQWDDGNRDNNNDHNDNSNEYNDNDDDADNDNKDNNKDGNKDSAAAVAGGGWQ